MNSAHTGWLRQKTDGNKDKALGLLSSTRLPTLVLCVVYLLIAILLPAGGFLGGDHGVKLYQVQALAQSHSLSVDTIENELSIFRPTFDMFYTQVGNHYQSIFPPAYAVLVLPFYLLFGLRGVVFPSILGNLISSAGSGLIGKTLGFRYPGAVTLVVGLASPLIVFGFILWEHAFSVGLMIFATFLVMNHRALMGGLLAAFAVWFRPEAMFIVPALALATLWAFGIPTGKRDALRLFIGFFIGISPWWIFNSITFGTLLGPQVAQNPIIFENRLSVIALHLLPLGLKRWAVFLVSVLGLAIFLRFFRRSQKFAFIFFLFGVVAINISFAGLYVQGVAPSISDVFPFLFAAFAALFVKGQKIDQMTGLVWLLTFSYLLGVTLLTPTWGGGWGPRMLLGAIPLLAVLGWKSFEIHGEKLLKTALTAVLVSSFFIQVAGLSFLSTEQQKITQLNSELASLKPNLVATSVWWLPQVGAATADQIRWYGITSISDIKKLMTLENCFWWVWTNEVTADSWEHPLHHSAIPTEINLQQMDAKTLPIRGLEAIQYCAVN